MEGLLDSQTSYPRVVVVPRDITRIDGEAKKSVRVWLLTTAPLSTRHFDHFSTIVGDAGTIGERRMMLVRQRIQRYTT